VYWQLKSKIIFVTEQQKKKKITNLPF